MELLSQTEMNALLLAISVLHSEVDIKTLPQRTVSAVESLVPCEFVAFDGFGSDDKFARAEWYNDYEIASPQNVAIFAECFNANPQEHPLALEVVGKKRRDAVKISDFVSREKFRRTPLYNEFFRRVGLNYQMAVALPVTENLLITCGVDRVSADFSESERTMLTMIAPHLLAAIRNAQLFGQLQDERMLLQTAVEAVAQGVIVLDSGGQIRFISDAAEKLIEKYFADERLNAGFLPEKLRSYVEHYNNLFAAGNKFYLPLPKLAIKQKTSELRVRFSFSSRIREMTLLLEEQENLSPANFLALGLTKREAEVLFWITQGKTNMEIGNLCGISWRTVQKHTEHIFDKLGVETRTAAVMFAMEKLH